MTLEVGGGGGLKGDVNEGVERGGKGHTVAEGFTVGRRCSYPGG